jgi:hypothetical protein
LVPQLNEHPLCSVFVDSEAPAQAAADFASGLKVLS